MHHPIKRHLKLISGTILLLVAGLLQAAERPNIIFVYTDDFGWGDMQCTGGDFVPTPNMDRMAAEGIRFTQFYVPSPICSASRTGVTTGMFPGRWRITSYLQTRKGNAKCEQADFLDSKAPSLARILQANGYATGHFGKWHMGGGRDVTNAPSIHEYGFDEYISTWESPDPCPDITATDWIWSDKDNVKRWDRTQFFVDKALDFLSRHKGQPCYVNIWPDDTHTPFVPSPAMSEKFGGSKRYQSEPNFKGVLAEYDKQMGRLMEGLKRLGLTTNTLVVFSGDNGPLPTYNHRRTGGLRGSKLSLYEGGNRLPLIVWWPGKAPAGELNEQTVISGVDLLPSLCQIAGAKIPAEVAGELDGQDLSSAFSGGTPMRSKPIFWEYGRNEKSFAYPKVEGDRSPNVAVRDGDWKLLVNADGSDVELFDLAKDPKEKMNVASKNPDVVKRLTALALDWRKSLPKTTPINL